MSGVNKKGKNVIKNIYNVFVVKFNYKKTNLKYLFFNSANKLKLYNKLY